MINGTEISSRLFVVTGDITRLSVDAVVNAANTSLMGGGGVDGAIHRAGGKIIHDECLEIRKTDYPDGLPTGEAVVTSGGDMPAEYVIHTVGPVWHGGNSGEDGLLKKAYLNSLRRASELGVKRVAFPAVSTGIYGFPKKRAARIVFDTVTTYLSEHPEIEAVYLVFFSFADGEAFLSVCG